MQWVSVCFMLGEHRHHRAAHALQLPQASTPGTSQAQSCVSQEFSWRGIISMVRFLARVLCYHIPIWGITQGITCQRIPTACLCKFPQFSTCPTRSGPWKPGSGRDPTMRDNGQSLCHAVKQIICAGIHPNTADSTPRMTYVYSQNPVEWNKEYNLPYLLPEKKIPENIQELCQNIFFSLFSL